MSGTMPDRDPGDVKEFLAEARLYLDKSEPLLAAMRAGGGEAQGADDIAAVFRAFHSIKGVAGFLSFAVVQEVTHKAEEALDRVRAGKRPLDAELGGALLEACDFLRACLDSIESSGTDAIRPQAQAELVARLKGFSDLSPSPLAAPTRDAEGGPEGWLYPWLLADGLRDRFLALAGAQVEAVEATLIGILDAPTRLSILGEAADQIDRVRLHASAFGLPAAVDLCVRLSQGLRRPRGAGSAFDPSEISALFGVCNALKPLLASGSPAQADLESARVSSRNLETLYALPAAPARPAAADPSAGNGAPPAAAANGGSPAKASPPAEGGKGEIRVGLDKLDRMVELVEELGVVSAGVVYEVEDLGEDHSLSQAAAKMRQITEELQEINVSIRMVPISTVFRKMIRLVGDVSAKLGKKARLELVGEETELDRDAAEALQDPLVHMIRNCVDHGLEMPEDRVAAGKPETGIIRLQAWHSGGEACLSVSDDGRGIDRARLVAKAVEKGLAPAGMSPDDAEALDLIFHPGFSLAKEVTEFSGRGVGMDVVKRNIEGLKGRVDVESKLGEGSAFRIRIPLSNALTESMLVRVGSAKYVLRVASIRETFRPMADAVVTLPDGAELVRLRGSLYPVVRLHRVHRVRDAETELEKGLIVLVENRGRQVGLFVDEVLGKIQAVIKPPPGFLKTAASLAGCSIIGTGSDAVALALDVNALEAAAAAALEAKDPEWQPC
jgi:two-component system chemotaxis sensor kinase CheA